MQLFYPLGLSSDNIGIDGFHDTTKNQPQSYISITGCVLSHILSCPRLSSLEKMYYILADSLSYINSSTGRNRSVSLPAASWAERLSCSKSEVFILQKSLEDKGYFLIYRDKNDKGQNNRNTITTTIPDHVFSDLKYEPNKFNLNSYGDIETQVTNYSQSNDLDSIDKTFIPTLEGKRQHLAKTKMFIRVPYQALKELNSNCNISATSKVVLLHLFTKIYKSSVSKYDHDNAVDYLIHNPFSIVISYQELQQELKLHRNSLTKAVKTLEEANLIKKDQIVIKSNDYCNNRADKSLWRISLVNVSHITNECNLHQPKGQIEYDEQKEQFDKQQIAQNTTNTTMHIYDQKNDIGKNKVLEPFTEKRCTKYDPPCTDSGQLYNKDFIINNSINENIDANIDKNQDEKNEALDTLEKNNQIKPQTFSQTSNSQHLESEQSSLSSKSLKNIVKEFIDAIPSPSNATCTNASKAMKENLSVVNKTNIPNNWNTVIHKKTTSQAKIINDRKNKDLRYFYPLSEKDANMLNFKANREFSTNFTNQLLLKLYIKDPEKRFKNKFTFSSYMIKALKNEHHQGPRVNNPSFRFSCNIDEQEKRVLECEQYLSKVESSSGTCKISQVKKKIAGRFSSEISHSILTTAQFIESSSRELLTILLPENIALSDMQREILMREVCSVYHTHQVKNSK